MHCLSYSRTDKWRRMWTHTRTLARPDDLMTQPRKLLFCLHGNQRRTSTRQPHSTLSQYIMLSRLLAEVAAGSRSLPAACTPARKLHLTLKVSVRFPACHTRAGPSLQRMSDRVPLAVRWTLATVRNSQRGFFERLTNSFYSPQLPMGLMLFDSLTNSLNSPQRLAEFL